MERRSYLEDYQVKVQGFMNPETLKDNKNRLTNAMLGLAGESGESCDIVKKYLHHGHDFDILKFKNELGDVLFYLTEACSCVDSTLEEIAQLNVEKLNARFEGKPWSSEASRAKKDELTLNLAGSASATVHSRTKLK